MATHLNRRGNCVVYCVHGARSQSAIPRLPTNAASKLEVVAYISVDVPFVVTNTAARTDRGRMDRKFVFSVSFKLFGNIAFDLAMQPFRFRVARLSAFAVAKD